MNTRTPESAINNSHHDARFYKTLAAGALLSTAIVIGLAEMGSDTPDSKSQTTVEQCQPGMAQAICEDVLGPNHN